MPSPSRVRALLALLLLGPLAGPLAAQGVPEGPGPWIPLFDGTKLDHWRGYRMEGFPTEGWVVEGDALRHVAGAGGGDLVTRDTYENFELEFSFRVAAGANSGVMYRVTEDADTTWRSGPEYQVLDDGGHSGLNPRHGCGALYGLYAPEGKPSRPAMTWRRGRVRQVGSVVEHWLDGRLVVRADLSSSDWESRVGASKFASLEVFAASAEGHVALQDHGDDVWYRDVRIRELSAAPRGEIPLFDGRSVDRHFTHFLRDETPMAEVWSVDDEGVLVCRGRPVGYLKTKDTWANYVLTLDWRFDPVTKKAGNSGVLLRLIGEDRIWPKSVEAQLMSGHAGDFWNIGDFEMKVAPERTRGRNTKKTAFAENPVGEWNRYRIVVHGGRVALHVNGELVNEASEVREVAGAIGLQSEGAEIHFRDIRLRPLVSPSDG